jgi:hypothetical protein
MADDVFGNVAPSQLTSILPSTHHTKQALPTEHDDANGKCKDNKDITNTKKNISYTNSSTSNLVLATTASLHRINTPSTFTFRNTANHFNRKHQIQCLQIK